MSNTLTVRGTIEMQGVKIYVRFAEDSPPELLTLSKREHVPRYMAPGPQLKSGEEGSFSIQIENQTVTVIGTHLNGREAYDEANAPSTMPTSSEKRRNRKDDIAGTGSNTSAVIESSKSPSDSTNIHTTSPTDDRFIHPYNFVRLPANGLGDASQVEPFGRRESAGHDIYDTKLYSGHIDCLLTTKTHWFIPDERKQTTDRPHKTLGYFTLQDVPAGSWHAAHADQDNTKPAIPGSSLRGMIRSVFEAATLSCFGVFDSGRLDFRIGYSPDHHGNKVGASGRGAARYVPCRIVECTDDDATIQLLDGRYEDPADMPIVLNVALVRAYTEKVMSGLGPMPQWQLLGDAPDGTPVVAFLTRPLKQNGKPYRWRVAHDPLAIGDKRNLPANLDNNHDIDDVTSNIESWIDQKGAETRDRYLVFGFLHRTGPNWREKKDERIFFDASACYNDPSHADYLTDIKLRLAAFLADTGKQCVVGMVRVRECLEALRGYAKRGGKTIRKAYASSPRHVQTDAKSDTGLSKKPLPSDFVLRHEHDVKIEVGDLFYALTEECPGGTTKIHGLYPVAIPRLSHEDSRGDLLHDDFYPCSRQHEICERCRGLSELPLDERKLCDKCQKSWKKLCPACRVFGWTRDLTHYRRADVERLKADSKRVDAIAGHVRFTHATLVGPWRNSASHQAELVTLPILSSPKPTTTGFYLDTADKDWKAEKANRWPPVTGEDDDRNPVSNLPVYRHEEAQLGGRKMYRRREATYSKSATLENGGLKNPLSDSRKFQTDQNQTIHALPPNLAFGFRIHFDNLAKRELGALLFAISLNAPPEWNAGSLSHALGHGKPLGMGGCVAEITELHLDANRYSSYHADEKLQPLDMIFPGRQSKENRKLVDSMVSEFTAAWEQACHANGLLLVTRGDLLSMLATVRNESIYYPTKRSHPDGSPKHENNYEWFAAAKLSGKQLASAADEINDPTTRLSRDPTR